MSTSLRDIESTNILPTEGSQELFVDAEDENSSSIISKRETNLFNVSSEKNQEEEELPKTTLPSDLISDNRGEGTNATTGDPEIVDQPKTQPSLDITTQAAAVEEANITTGRTAEESSSSVIKESIPSATSPSTTEANTSSPSLMESNVTAEKKVAEPAATSSIPPIEQPVTTETLKEDLTPTTSSPSVIDDDILPVSSEVFTNIETTTNAAPTIETTISSGPSSDHLLPSIHEEETKQEPPTTTPSRLEETAIPLEDESPQKETSTPLPSMEVPVVESVVPQSYSEIVHLYLSISDILPGGVKSFLHENKIAPHALTLTVLLGTFWLLLVTITTLLARSSKEKELKAQINAYQSTLYKLKVERNSVLQRQSSEGDTISRLEDQLREAANKLSNLQSAYAKEKVSQHV